MVNFTNLRRYSITSRSSNLKCTKKVRAELSCKKAAHKMLVKLTPDWGKENKIPKTFVQKKKSYIFVTSLPSIIKFSENLKKMTIKENLVMKKRMNKLHLKKMLKHDFMRIFIYFFLYPGWKLNSQILIHFEFLKIMI